MAVAEVIVGGVATLAIVWQFRRRQRRHRHPGETLEVIGRAVLDASKRGHRPANVTHFALALLQDPEVSAALDERGVATESVYDELENLLPAPAPPLTIEEMNEKGLDPELAKVIVASRGRKPAAVLDAVIQSDPAIGAIFERHGQARAPSPTGPSSPYRGTGAGLPAGDSLLVVWNDTKTTQEFVLQLLREELGVRNPCATQVMLTSHRRGCSIVGRYERDDAVRLARKAETRAREAGHPLRITVEDASFTRPLRRLGRWLRRP